MKPIAKNDNLLLNKAKKWRDLDKKGNCLLIKIGHFYRWNKWK